MATNKQKHTFPSGSWSGGASVTPVGQDFIPMMGGAQRSYHPDGSVPEPEPGNIFVFGSNLAGLHGAGAAVVARKLFAAAMGFSAGRCGMAYAIPTKDAELNVLPLSVIRPHVQRFVEYTAQHPELKFFVTRVGCGLSRYSDSDIAPMFKLAIGCSFPKPWSPYLPVGE